IELPWNMQLRTTLNMMCNSGYDVAEINKAQWLWDAMLSKSIMKGNLTFKLSANDILGQQKPYHITVDSQGRYETRTNTISRYVMLSVLYRFNKQPKKSKNQ
ncbi:MAG: outer membrane beta-barrel protein, partial [Muribaculaceae bacterium]|nr:outer membrane beta-barrel protein [Muribaculaceae bacterium]